VITVHAKLALILVFPFCLALGVADADENGSFPNLAVDSKTLRVQNQAEEVYERTEYERAFFIYRNELVPIGDKYAQYMVGYMYLTGKGVEEDRVAGSAWYRLAAERGTKEFVAASKRMMELLDEEQTAASDRLFIELRKQYGDLILMLRALKREQEILRTRTGSRVGSADTMPMTIISADRGRTTTGSDYYGQIERRMKARLEYLERQTNVEISDGNINTLDLDAIELLVSQQLSRVD
jgi:hypothetical protein